jgi:hypothetical protein
MEQGRGWVRRIRPVSGPSWGAALPAGRGTPRRARHSPPGAALPAGRGTPSWPRHAPSSMARVGAFPGLQRADPPYAGSRNPSYTPSNVAACFSQE